MRKSKCLLCFALIIALLFLATGCNTPNTGSVGESDAATQTVESAGRETTGEFLLPDIAADYSRLRLQNIGFIFQSYNLIPTLSCKENILLPVMYGRSWKQENFDRLVDLLQIEHLLSQRVVTLSGGEKQRVAIARSLILDPCLILADEPTGNLDPQNREIIVSLLRHEHQCGRGIILITHDAQTAAAADTILRLEGGVLHEA